ncbi:alpha/beta fold hydrolase [Marininema halotolerans]|uniref:Pimeloyl-ACP methyl ester carboxylesterase n=1 Tax=Marininema halotolerans TaxID=1155944 RepID=A0A1I6R9A4_9BACL|nr:alpha/beta hydrolase [Marininema halotolerans]SFS61265.1 Pimeloyl-ACP methyl ester carboxylesterase [Marininema halotolerans]
MSSRAKMCPLRPILNPNTFQTIVALGAEGFRISVKVTGNPNGIPIVFIHGFSESWLIWNFQLSSPLLLRKYKLIAIDMRGQGESQPKSLNPSHYIKGVLYAKDIDAVFNQFVIHKAIVVAHSLGGTWLADYLDKFGTSRIRGIIFVSSKIESNTPVADSLVSQAFKNTLPLLTNPCLEITSVGLNRFLSLLFNGMLPLKNEQEILSYVALVPSQIRSHLAQHEPLRAKDILPYVKVPVLVLGSRGDRVENFQASVKVSQLASNSKLILFQNIGHTIMAEIPTIFNIILNNFVMIVS